MEWVLFVNLWPGAQSVSETPSALARRSCRIPQRFVVEKPARCWVATWPALSQAESGQDILLVSDVSSASAQQFLFKLGVMIVKHNNKFVCMFRCGVRPCVRVRTRRGCG